MVRGKPETFNRPDYNFRLEGADDGGEPRGDETVQITTRKRGAPLDLIVAEAMILANSTWGAWLAACGVPGIYRSQASLAPGVKVRMGVKPAPHAGMGVAQYTWATSPLRRYVDLVNQWQIVACARHGRTAALAAPFKPRTRSCSRSSRHSTRPTARTPTSSAASSATGPCVWLSQHGMTRTRCQRHEGWPGACRDTAAGVQGARLREPCRAARTCVCASPAVDRLTLDVHASLLATAR